MLWHSDQGALEVLDYAYSGPTRADDGLETKVKMCEIWSILPSGRWLLRGTRPPVLGITAGFCMLRTTI